MLVKCLVGLLVLTSAVLFALPSTPKSVMTITTPANTPEELLAEFDRLIARIENKHQGIPFEQWPEFYQNLWLELNEGRKNRLEENRNLR